MAKDNRVMHTGIEVGGRTFVPGEEDELEEVMTARQLDYLKEQDVLEGSWEAKGKEAPPMPGSRVLREAAVIREAERTTLDETAEAIAGRVISRLSELQPASSAAPTEPGAKKLDRMTRAELEALATEKGVTIPEGAENKDIRELLRAAGVEG